MTTWVKLEARERRIRAVVGLALLLMAGMAVLCRAPRSSMPVWPQCPSGAVCMGAEGPELLSAEPRRDGPLAVDVKFRLDTANLSPLDGGALVRLASGVLRECVWASPALHRCRARPLFLRSLVALAVDRAAATRISGRACPDLAAWWRLTLPARSDMFQEALVEALVARLAADPRVAAVSVEPDAVPAELREPIPFQGLPKRSQPPPAGEGESAVVHPARCTSAFSPMDGDTCPIDTPKYDARQGYLAAAPAGIDALAAWALPGGRGQGVRVGDVEGGWNAEHEDLPGQRMEHVAGRRFTDRGWEAHGTAVVGVVASRDNGLGMIGIAPDVERIYTASIGGIGVPAAIDGAASHLRAGDVLIIELHGPGPHSRRGGGQKGYVPMEWWPAAFDAIQLHARRGVVIVEAAGNGGEDLDDPIYGGAFDRNKRDSGAIMAGAGAPPVAGFVDRSRLDFSNYGSRLDLQGWGRHVATLDYGDLQSCDDTRRKYTVQFSGTSSASPVVAGAILCLEGIARARGGTILDPATVRDILRQTGSPQTDGPGAPSSQRIGPRPDLARGISRLQSILLALGR